jgi:hypothetical protein
LPALDQNPITERKCNNNSECPFGKAYAFAPQLPVRADEVIA